MEKTLFLGILGECFSGAGDSSPTHPCGCVHMCGGVGCINGKALWSRVLYIFLSHHIWGSRLSWLLLHQAYGELLQ